jgi:hypothetical protein
MVLLALAYAAIRCTNLDRMVTTDEMHWLGRSANFYRALQTGELRHTYQMAHPGIMTMWAGALAYWIHVPDYAPAVPENLDTPGFKIESTLRGIGVEPLDILNAARISKILLQTAFYAGCLYFLNRLFPRAVMVLAGALIAFDPFLSGLDSVLHVDGLFAIAATCALLSICRAFAEGFDTVGSWVTSGAIGATVWLTRTHGLIIPAIFTLTLGAIVLTRLIRGRTGRATGPVRQPVLAGLAYGLSWIAASLLLLPALWVGPGRVIEGIWSFTNSAIAEGHEGPLFFNGHVTRGDPGLSFYPVTLLWRLTPQAQLGLALLLIMTWHLARTRRLDPTMLRSAGFLALFVTLFTVGMSLGAKKFDRYLLPVYPVLDILAACGYVLAAEAVVTKWSSIRRHALPTMVSVLTVLQVWATAGVLPYRLDYFNPLMGGATAAADELQMGWGQGADQVLAFVRRPSADDQVTVVTSTWSSGINWLNTSGDGRLRLNPAIDPTEPQGWYETDFFGLGIQDKQRGTSLTGAYLAGREPVFVAWVEGVPHFEVYRVNAYPYPTDLIKQTNCMFEVGNGLTLLQVAQAPGAFDFYFLSTSAERPDELQFSVTQSGTWLGGVTFEYHDTVTLRPSDNGRLSKFSVPNHATEAGMYSNTYSFSISATDASGTAVDMGRPGAPNRYPEVSLQSNCYATLG